MTEQLKIMPVEPCGAIGKCMASPSSYASRLNSYSTPKQSAVATYALRELESARQRDIESHEKNQPALEVNKAIAAQIVALNESVGMPKSWSERDRTSRARYPKTITHQAGYLSDVLRECKTNDGFAMATQTYERLLRDYREFEVKAKEEDERAARKAESAKAAELDRRKADMELASILLRYSLPIESSWSDVLDALATRDQRLGLAVAMQRTRNDWNEGPWRVRDALDAFTITTDEDKSIANDVIDCLRDFEDGRVFRDTTWNYGRLFAEAADQQLSADLQRAVQQAGG